MISTWPRATSSWSATRAPAVETLRVTPRPMAVTVGVVSSGPAMLLEAVTQGRPDFLAVLAQPMVLGWCRDRGMRPQLSPYYL